MNQDIGSVLVDLLPSFVEIMIWLLVGGLITILILQIFKDI
jgi:hypothetical protein